MSMSLCGATWNAGGKDHYCGLPQEHIRKCECDCGERGYAANPPPSAWQPKPFYKRRKLKAEGSTKLSVPRSVREVAKELGFQPVPKAEQDRRFDNETRMAAPKGEDLGVQELPAKWECFIDPAYYHMWCVRRIGETRFGHGYHVQSKEEARALCDELETVSNLSSRCESLTRDRNLAMDRAAVLKTERDTARAKLADADAELIRERSRCESLQAELALSERMECEIYEALRAAGCPAFELVEGSRHSRWVNSRKQIARLGAEVATLQDSLRKLSNEASGFLAMADRQTHGNTNMAVLKMRIDDARALLEPKSESAPKPDIKESHE